jgi:hypothetical protein
MKRRVTVCALVGAVLFGVSAAATTAGSIPSGERAFGQSVVEPVYNAENAGQIGFILTPNHVPDPVKTNPRAWAPIYLPVYPVGSTAASTYVCMHTPSENCPTHGDAIAGLAASVMPSVYGGGVAGHDHLLDFPGGADFNIAWEPIVVLFTNAAAANQHLLTDQDVANAVASGNAIEIPLPFLTFHCSVVPAAVYNHGTPLAP